MIFAGENKQQPLSWGRVRRFSHRLVPLFWRHEVPPLASLKGALLPYGKGRSYGDSCLNEGGILLCTPPMNRFIGFDEERGILTCEAGVTLDRILMLIVPRGFFLPVVPGTTQITVGGAVANDVHGKNHHRAGTFGRFVRRLEILRSSGERLLCSPTENEALFRATIGGLGLTGLILWVEFSLDRIESHLIEAETVRFSSLEGFFELSERSDADFEYTAAWIDGLAGRGRIGRGLFFRGNFSKEPPRKIRKWRLRPRATVPFDFPHFVLSPATVGAFNRLYYHGRLSRISRSLSPFPSFFFPLDALGAWNRMYGRRGFVQWQCVVPADADRKALAQIFRLLPLSAARPFLAVLKAFGEVSSPGLLSFPRRGTTLCLDIPFLGTPTLDLCRELDAVVVDAGGAIYPAKDLRMSPATFRAGYPLLSEFLKTKDPKFSSNFWRRMTSSDQGELL